MPPSDWQSRLTDLVEEKIDERGDKKRPHRDFRVRMPLGVVAEVRAAAAARDMSCSAYMRRCVLAFVSVDRGIAFADLLQEEPPHLRPGGNAMKPITAGPEEHGAWRIGSLS